MLVTMTMFATSTFSAVQALAGQALTTPHGAANTAAMTDIVAVRSTRSPSRQNEDASVIHLSGRRGVPTDLAVVLDTIDFWGTRVETARAPTAGSACARIQCWDQHLEEPSLEVPIRPRDPQRNTTHFLIRAT
jgi:hypothetical protein